MTSNSILHIAYCVLADCRANCLKSFVVFCSTAPQSPDMIRLLPVAAICTVSLALTAPFAVAIAQVPTRLPTDSSTRLAAFQQHRQMTLASPFVGMQWTAMGPKINGGRVEAIAVPPGNTGTMYVGMASGSLWKTDNNGLTWRSMFANQSSFAIGDVAVAPSDANVVWVGTGEAQPRHSGYAYAGTGVFKSTDAGNTWQHMGLSDTHHIGKVLIDPRNADNVYVAAMGHFWSNNAQRGVFKTTNGGKSWTKTLYINDSTGVVDVVMDPSDSRVVYAWAWNISSGRNGGVFKSTDSGATWRHITAGLPTGLMGRAGLDVAPSTPNVVYAYIDNQAPRSTKEQPTVGGEVYRSDDRGEHWRKVNIENLYSVFGEFGWKFCDVRVAPDNADEIFILGNRGMHSTDGGKTYARIGEEILRVHDTPGKALHLDHHEIWIDPLNTNRILLGNDGGVFQSYDRGRTWLHMNNIPAVQFYFIAADTGAAPYRVFGGTQDNAAVYGPSTARVEDATADAWKYVYLDRWTGGDSYVTIPDPTDPRIVYYEHQNGGMLRMDITGTSVVTSGPSAVNIRPRAPRGDTAYQFGWYTPFFLSRYDPKTLYVGGNRVLKSVNRGDSWTPMSPDLSDSPTGLRGAIPLGTITMMSESPFSQGELFVGTEGGNIWRTTYDGAAWNNVSNGLPSKWVSRVIASEHRAGTVYASLTGYRQDDFTPYLYVSDNSGQQWRSIAAGLPTASINVIKEDPVRADVLYVGTDLGVYVSLDRGKSWLSLSGNLPTAAVHDLAVQAHEHELLLASYGLGAWKVDVGPLEALTDAIRTSDLHLFAPKPVTLDYFPWETVPGDRRERVNAALSFWSKTSGDVTLRFANSTGQVVKEFLVSVAAGITTVSWDLFDVNGAQVKADTYRVEVVSATGRANTTMTVHPRVR